MLVSWKWLSRYVDLSMPREELESRFALSGLNHESTEPFGDDWVIDLEVTSNRGDCLGHIGVAREVSVLYDTPLKLPTLSDKLASTSSESAKFGVTNQATESCPRYIARLIEGVKVGPSPKWMVDELAAIGVNSINNVVDATNYVMFECGQPLHAFDFDRLDGGQIIVRQAKAGETIQAIDHRTYTLEPTMCVIADASRPVAVAGVMGGADTEVTDQTRNVLVEAAAFAPLSVRRTARKLKLASPSSFRYERHVDQARLDWASQRVCDLILQMAGGRLSSTVIDTQPASPEPATITLRFAQIKRLLGIEVSNQEVSRILQALGCTIQSTTAGSSETLTVQAPSWRRDLSREVDLIEEIARIHGYDKIPEDQPIQVAPSAKRSFDTAVEKVRSVMVASGFCEAMTPSIVTDRVDNLLSPWTDRAALSTQTAMLEGARTLRRSLLPSLLHSRAANWAAASVDADLFEIAHVYLPGEHAHDLPKEQYTLGCVTGFDFFEAKGLVDLLINRLGIEASPCYEPLSISGLDQAWSVAIKLGEQTVGYLGQLDAKLQRELKLPGKVVLAELSLYSLLNVSKLVPTQKTVSAYPAIVRDLNFIVAEQVRWSALEAAVRAAVGVELETVQYREIYRDPAKDGADTKRILLSVELRKPDGTLTHAEAEGLVQSILTSCAKQVGAKLLA